MTVLEVYIAQTYVTHPAAAILIIPHIVSGSCASRRLFVIECEYKQCANFETGSGSEL